MKTKSFGIHQLLILICLFTSFANAGLSDLIHNDPWKFLRDKFITAPNSRASHVMPTITKSIFGLGVGIGSGIGAKAIHKKYLEIDPLDAPDDFQEFTSSLSYYSIIPVSIIMGCLAYYKIHNALVARYQRTQLIDLLNNWPRVKSRMPSNLQSGFEEIYQEYKAYPRDFKHKCDDIIRVIKQQIDDQFEDKSNKKFWDAKFLTGNIILDIGNTIASFVSIFKK